MGASRSVALVIVAACTKAPEAVTLPSATSTATTISITTSLVRPCAITVSAPRTFAIPPKLAKIAPQYFHASAHDDGFNDLIAGTNRYAWYDPSDLDTAVEPPTGMAMIRRSTKSYYFGWTDDAWLEVARRSDTAATKLRFKGLHDLDAVEDSAGHAWLLLGDLNATHVMSAIQLVRVDPSLAITDATAATLGSAGAWDRRIALTADGHVGVVWVENAADGLSVLVSWQEPAGFTAPRVIDHVRLSSAAAELSLRSTVNLRVAAEGAASIAVGWRPLAPKENEVVDLGTQSQPPEHPATAEVRIVTANPAGNTALAHAHVARAMPLGGTSGIGPWPLQGDGMNAATLGGHAIFFWIDDSTATAQVVWATTADASPHVLVAGSFRLLPRATRTGLELLLLESAGTQQLATVECR